MPTYNLLPNNYSSKTINQREFDILKKLVVKKSKIPIEEIDALLFTHIHANVADTDFNILLKRMQDEIKRWKKEQIGWNFENCKMSSKSFINKLLKNRIIVRGMKEYKIKNSLRILLY